MFTPEELRKYAETLWWGLSTARPVPFAPGDRVLLRFDLEALPLAEALYPLLLEKGLLPVVRMNFTPSLEKTFYGRGSEAQITDVPPGDRELTEHLNGLISLIAPASLTHLAGVDPAKIGAAAVARKFLRDIMEKREQKSQFGWTLCAWPTSAMAEASGQTLEQYAAQIKKACFLDQPDPAARWAEVFAQAQEVKAWLNSLPIASLRVESAGTDLTLTPGAERRWLGVSGHNIPSFEIFLSPDWRGTRGTYFADQPSYRSGNLVRGVRLTFEDGCVTKVSADEGEEFVKKQVAMDPGAGRLGEFSLTDRRHSPIAAFMANTLFDENFGGANGNCHVAVGASYSDTYAGDQTSLDEAKKKALGFNDSALHWDLVNTEKKTVTASLADGASLVIYEDGQFRL
jgi:aminopeptidase